MENAYVLLTLRKWWWLLLGVAVLGGAGAYYLSTQSVPEYRAQATLLVVDQTTPGQSRTPDLNTSANLAAAFSDLGTLRPFLEDVQTRGEFDMSLGAIRGSIDVSAAPGSQFVQITATSTDPEIARDLANVLAEVFIESPLIALVNEQTVITLVEEALTPGAPQAESGMIPAAAGGLAAFVVAAGILLLFAYLDDTVQSAGQIRELVGLLTVGQIGQFKTGRDRGDSLVSASHPSSETAEAYRSLRTNLGYSLDSGEDSEPQRVVVITSATTDEGKSTTAANLAIVFGDAGMRVALVDADLRRPSLHHILHGDNGMGLTNLLTSLDQSVQGALQSTAHPNVSLISAGPVPSNPSELLGAPRLSAVLGQLREQFDIVLIDSPPMLGVSDALLATRAADSVLLVVRAGKTRTRELQELVEQLARTGRPIAGVVLNRDSQANRRGRYYYSSERFTTPEPPEPRDLDPRSIRQVEPVGRPTVSDRATPAMAEPRDL